MRPKGLYVYFVIDLLVFTHGYYWDWPIYLSCLRIVSDRINVILFLAGPVS